MNVKFIIKCPQTSYTLKAFFFPQGLGKHKVCRSRESKNVSLHWLYESIYVKDACTATTALTLWHLNTGIYTDPSEISTVQYHPLISA